MTMSAGYEEHVIALNWVIMKFRIFNKDVPSICWPFELINILLKDKLGCNPFKGSLILLIFSFDFPRLRVKVG
jgi:hypothetical protein